MYYLIQHSEDGEYLIDQYGDSQEILDEIKANNEDVEPEYRWEFVSNLKDFIEGDIYKSILIIEGEVIVPKPIKIVEGYTL